MSRMICRHIPLAAIVDNPFRPRTTFDEAALQSLAQAIKAEGFWDGHLQARRRQDGKFELVFGHRRLRALRLLNYRDIALELVELTDAQMALRALDENLQREGLSDVEKAAAVKQVVELTRAERKAAGKPSRGAMEAE